MSCVGADACITGTLYQGMSIYLDTLLDATRLSACVSSSSVCALVLLVGVRVNGRAWGDTSRCWRALKELSAHKVSCACMLAKDVCDAGVVRETESDD